MKNCIICNSPKLIKIPGKIVPFLMHRMKIEGSDQTDLNKCANCHFFYYSFRPSDKQMENYYFDYWGENYQKERHSFEPRFTKEFCEVLKNHDLIDNQFSKNQKYRLSTTLKNLKIDLSKISSILDYGGNDGKNMNISEFENIKKYVYDIGKIKVIENITNISNQPFEQIKENFDLVLCQHLLEHVSYPLREMEKIFYSLKKGGYLYFEVPQGNRADNLFNLKRDIASYIFPWYRKYLSKLFFKKNDFYIMHEHINYFNKKSIKALCKESGLKIIKCFESEIIMRDKNNDLVFKTKIVYGMAKKI